MDRFSHGGCNPAEITQVYSYSIETIDDGTNRIWALGKAAWYHIRPAEEYKHIFEKTLQKAKLWTFTEDAYMTALGDRRKKKPLSSTFEQLYHDYAKYDKLCRFPFQAKKWYERHHRFITVRMLENMITTGLDWTRTPIYAYYQKEYPEEIKELKEVLKRQKMRANEGGGDDGETETSPPPPSLDVKSSEPKTKQESASDTPSITRRRRRRLSREASSAMPSPSSSSRAEVLGRVAPQNTVVQQQSQQRSRLRLSRTITTPTNPSFTEFDNDTIQVQSISTAPLLGKRKWDVDSDIGTEDFADDAATTSRSTLRPVGCPIREPSPMMKRSRSLSPTPNVQERLQILKLQFEEHGLKEEASRECDDLLDKKKKIGVLESYELPNAWPDENGFWKCQYAGGMCRFKVDNANEIAGLWDIENHIKEHAKDMRKILGVIGVESIGRLPKIRFVLVHFLVSSTLANA